MDSETTAGASTPLAGREAGGGPAPRTGPRRPNPVPSSDASTPRGSSRRRGAAATPSLGMAIEVAASLAALGVVLAYARHAGLGAATGALCLLAASPLIGEFAVTMSDRYRPGMSSLEAFARLLRPSSCDSCSKVLSQWDILPLAPYLLRRGRCSCRAFRIPRDCTLAGLASAVLSLLVVLACHAQGWPLASALPPLALLLLYAPAMVSDVVHGEVDEYLALLPIPILVLVAPTGPATALACGSGSALLVLGSALLGAAFRRSLSPLPVGLVDLAVAFGAGCALDLPRLVSANVFLVPVAAASWYLARRSSSARRRYGPSPAECDEVAAFPMVPAIVASSVLGYLWLVADALPL